ncbi:hypothetical protein NQ317_001959 [Molorchus minor]|uniref:Transcription termination factor 5, mitochondrial n=1 Tax=Molorchus minor TaxID=1323400 RepID=A0ABQ9JA55_9CUCU|nr:hypothetical protein NQ317_001959 [Molorchus minor]
MFCIVFCTMFLVKSHLKLHLVKKNFSNSANLQILCDTFGLLPTQAKTYIDTHKLNHKDGELLIASIESCKKIGYKNEEILANPGLLRTHPLELEQHYLSLEEGGFNSLKPNILARARYYMKRQINRLKARNIICITTDVPQNFLKYIEDKELVEKIPLIYNSDYLGWNEVHFKILQSFLKFKLEATDDEIIKLFRTHKMIKNKSFRVIQENIALAEDLGFERRKILKFGYLIHNYPKYTKTVLTDFSNLAGADMRTAMRQYPKLIMASPKNIVKIYGILKEFEIDDDIIKQQMNVFCMSPETVRLRLEEINRILDLRVLLKHPRILSLVVHHNRARSRLSFLQQLQIKCASLAILRSDSKECFDEYVREGKDINKPSDVIYTLKNMFSMDINDVKKKIAAHPYYLQVPIKDMQDAYDYLIARHFKKENIFKVLHIILYPVDKIEISLGELQTSKEFKFESLSQVKKLRLVLYLIEKEHHFTGNGIWRKCNTDMSDKTLE